jgi:DNA-binding NtrC family response regulator
MRRDLVTAQLPQHPNIVTARPGGVNRRAFVEPSRKTTRIFGESTITIERLELVIVSGPDKGLRRELEGPVIIGNDPACDCVLKDDTVSSRHCEVSVDGKTVIVRDLSSTNGVFVGDVRMKEGCIALGSKVRLGRTVLVVKSKGKADIEVLETDHFGRLFGRGRAMQAAFARLRQCAASDAPLLIEGETGTGKDIAAEAVHEASARAEEPCVVFDCAAVAPSILEGELFGFEKGAFTGATTTRAGLAERADGGTLIIDELGELPLDVQPKLLRLIERQEVRRLGSDTPRRVNLRFIACTHRHLPTEVKAGRFREDLYYRISALTVRLPSLREHLEDVPALIDELLRRSNATVRFDDLSEGERSMLLSHRWPGNVRELRNVIDRLIVFRGAPQESLLSNPSLDSAPPASDVSISSQPLAVAREAAHEQFERSYLQDVLRRAQGSISEAARFAGVSRQFVQKLMRKHGMR